MGAGDLIPKVNVALHVYESRACHEINFLKKPSKGKYLICATTFGLFIMKNFPQVFSRKRSIVNDSVEMDRK